MDPNQFFGHHLDPLSLVGKAIALSLSVILSGSVGFERQCRGQPAGLRTHILVGVGATLITLTSVEFGIGGAGAHGDGARLAAQIVSGIGFLGAGAIIRDGLTVHGLTTAASIWVVAAIGIAIGAGPRLGEVAVVATLIVLATLTILTWLEDTLHLKQNLLSLRVVVQEPVAGPARVLTLLAENHIIVQAVEFENGSAETAAVLRTMLVRIKLPAGYARSKCLLLLANEASIKSFDLT